MNHSHQVDPLGGHSHQLGAPLPDGLAMGAAAPTGGPALLATAEAQLRDLLNELGCQGHAGAVVAIRTLRKHARLDGPQADAERARINAGLPAATADRPRTTRDAIRASVQRLHQWLYCMSYNDSYFGEPAGLVKREVAELERLTDRLQPTGLLAAEDPAEAAYWEMDARVKGYGEWKGRPQSERDAFKAVARQLLRAA